MSMKKLFLGALLTVSAMAFGDQQEVGQVGGSSDSPTAVATGSAKLDLEARGSVRSITKGTIYLVLESDANNVNDKDKMTFNFGTINKGQVSKMSGQFTAKLFVGTTDKPENGPTDEVNWKPVTFAPISDGTEIPTEVKLVLVGEDGVEVEHGTDVPAKIDMPVTNRVNKVVGALQYGLKNTSLTNNNTQLKGTVTADLYTKGATLPPEMEATYGNLSSLTTHKIDENATGDFVSNGGKFVLKLEALDLSHDANIKAEAPSKRTY